MPSDQSLSGSAGQGAGTRARVESLHPDSLPLDDLDGMTIETLGELQPADEPGDDPGADAALDDCD